MVKQQKTDINQSIYSQNKGLLFQFVLSEFIHASRFVQKIASFLNASLALRFDQLDDVLELVPPLTGEPVSGINERCFPWAQNQGSLNKLKHYSYLMSQKMVKTPLVGKLLVSSSIAFHSASQIREVITTLKYQHEEGVLLNYKPLYQFIGKLVDHMQLLTSYICEILFFFKDDASVLLFLLQQQEDLDAIYYKNFVKQTLCQMFPEGLEQVQDFVTEEYNKKGFVHLKDLILNQVNQLNT